MAFWDPKESARFAVSTLLPQGLWAATPEDLNNSERGHEALLEAFEGILAELPKHSAGADAHRHTQTHTHIHEGSYGGSGHDATHAGDRGRRDLGGADRDVGRGGGGGATLTRLRWLIDKQRMKPIIIVPSSLAGFHGDGGRSPGRGKLGGGAPQSAIRFSNASAFFSGGRLDFGGDPSAANARLPGSGEGSTSTVNGNGSGIGGASPSGISSSGKISIQLALPSLSRRPIPFSLVDSKLCFKFGPRDWEAVVAVCLDGSEWQMRNWPARIRHSNEMLNYFTFDDEPLPRFITAASTIAGAPATRAPAAFAPMHSGPGPGPADPNTTGVPKIYKFSPIYRHTDSGVYIDFLQRLTEYLQSPAESDLQMDTRGLR